VPEFIQLGRVMGAHGLRGEIRVRCFADDPEVLLSIPSLRLVSEGEAAVANRFAVRAARTGARPGEVLILLEGISDREGAQALRGLSVVGLAEDLPALGEGEYYWYQLIGCRVESLEGLAIGVVLDLWDAGAHQLLVVRDEQGRQVLIPTAAAILREIDLEAQVLRVDAIPGLLEGLENAPEGE